MSPSDAKTHPRRGRVCKYKTPWPIRPVTIMHSTLHQPPPCGTECFHCCVWAHLFFFFSCKLVFILYTLCSSLAERRHDHVRLAPGLPFRRIPVGCNRLRACEEVDPGCRTPTFTQPSHPLSPTPSLPPRAHTRTPAHNGRNSRQI